MKPESKPLSWWIKNLSRMSRDIWFWIPNETDVLTPDTICFAVEDEYDLSADEQDQRDADLEACGLKCFFFKDQLEDIQSNLKAQKRSYDQEDLYAALNYYWENDSFLDMGGS